MASERQQTARLLIVAAWIATTVASALGQKTTVPATQPDPAKQAVNPHWSSTGCKECHGPGQIIAIPAGQVEPICRRCHEGVQASHEVHPVCRLFVKGEVEKPAGWPAPGDRLDCITCHDARLACDSSNSRTDAGHAFLRTLPPYSPGGFCGVCHVAAAMAGGGRYKPHKMLDAAVHGREACLVCHLPTFKLDAHATRTGNAGLRREGIDQCVGCHSQHNDYFEPGHIGLTLTPAIKTRLTRVAAASAPANHPTNQTSTLLPLGGGDRIVCVTCHNPHPQGLFPAGSEMSEGERTEGFPNPLGLRGPAKDVCRVCHHR